MQWTLIHFTYFKFSHQLTTLDFNLHWRNMTAVNIKAFKRTSIEFDFKFKFLIFFGLASLATPRPVLLFTMLSTRESALAIVQIFAQTFACPQSWDQVKEICKGRRKQGGQRGGTSPPVFERSVDLKSTKGENYALHIITRPPQILKPSDIPIYSFVGTFLVTWKPICMDWQKGLVWLQAICTCPQKAIVGLQKFLHRWIPCKKSL